MANVRCFPPPLGRFRRWRALPLRQQWRPGGPRGLHARAGGCPPWPSSARPSARRPVPTAAPRTASASMGRARARPCGKQAQCGQPLRAKRLAGRCLGRPEPQRAAARSLPRASCARPEPRCFRHRCEAAFAGLDCSSKRCPNDCGGESNGLCMADGVCECHDGFGPRTPGGVNDCLGRLCATACGPHGTCDSGTGECACEPGWTGRACAEQGCPSMCSGHGVCNTSAAVATCQCDAGYSGADCATQGLGQGFRVRVLR